MLEAGECEEARGRLYREQRRQESIPAPILSTRDLQFQFKIISSVWN
jgi:hypothetical protein